MSQQPSFDQAVSPLNLVALVGQLTPAERAELAASPETEHLRVQLSLAEALMQQVRTAEKLQNVRTAVDSLWNGMPQHLRDKLKLT